MMGASLRPEMLSIPEQQALHRPRELLLARAAALYRTARFDDIRDLTLPVRCHALAWRHLHDETAQARIATTFAFLPSPAVTSEAALPGTFVACALALSAGVETAASTLERTWALLEQFAWLEHRELYASPVRNGEACAGLLTAFESGGDLRYLRRAETLCRTITARTRPELRAHCQWALLLLRLARHPVALAHPGNWLVPHAKRLFDTQVPTLSHKDGFGRIAQAVAVATVLAARTGAPRLLQWQERIWKLCWQSCLELRDDSPETVAAVLHAVDQLTLPW